MFCPLQEIRRPQGQNDTVVYQTESPISVEIKQILEKSFGDKAVDIWYSYKRSIEGIKG